MEIKASGKKTIDVPESFSFPAEIDIQAADGENKLPRIFIKANTGTEPMEMDGWPLPVVIDFKGTKLRRKKLPIIVEHDPNRRVGHSEDAVIIQAGATGTLDGKTIKGPLIAASGVVSSTSQDAVEFTADAKNGFPWEASLGAKSKQAGLELIEAGETGEANGKTFKGPLIISRQSRIEEWTVTPIGADRSTSVKIAATSKKLNSFVIGGDETMEFEKWLKAKMGLDIGTLTDEQIVTLKAEHKRVEELEIKAAGTPPPIVPDPDPEPEPTLAEKTATIEADQAQRSIDIRAAAAKPEFKDAKGIELGGQKDLTLEAASVLAIRDPKITPQEFQLACHNGQLNYNPTPAIHNVDKNLDAIVIEAALVKTGTTIRGDAFEALYPEKVLEATDRKDLRGFSLHQLMDLNIEAAGGHYRGNRKSDGFVRKFLEADRDLRASGQEFSTIAAGDILENVAHKALLNAFVQPQTVWQDICGVQTLNDFKAHSVYQLHIDGGYDVVAPDGELQHGTMTDTKRTVTGLTRGMMLVLTRVAMRNDDLGAFLQIPSALGRLAILAIEGAVLELLLANADSFFHGDNGNLSEGAGSDLDIAGLDAAATLFLDQVQDGHPILINPDRILVGSQDKGQAINLYEDTHVQHTATGDADTTDTLLTKNPHSGAFKPLVSPYLNNDAIKKMDKTAFSNQTSDKWYMFADPTMIAALVIGFLDGNQNPTIESAETDFNTLGMQWRSYHDWGVAQGEPKGAVLSDGA